MDVANVKHTEPPAKAVLAKNKQEMSQELVIPKTKSKAKVPNSTATTVITAKAPKVASDFKLKTVPGRSATDTKETTELSKRVSNMESMIEKQCEENKQLKDLLTQAISGLYAHQQQNISGGVDAEFSDGDDLLYSSDNEEPSGSKAKPKAQTIVASTATTGTAADHDHADNDKTASQASTASANDGTMSMGFASQYLTSLENGDPIKDPDVLNSVTALMTKSFDDMTTI